MNIRYFTLAYLLTLVVGATSQTRDCDLVIMEGVDLPCMLDQAPSDIVAFKFSEIKGWVQVPMQIDERVLLDISAPYNDAPCIEGKGTDSGIPWDILFYADTTTFIGADTLPNFDEDDELVFMARDLGEQATELENPDGVLDIRPCEISIYDSLDNTHAGYLYLFLQDGSLDQADKVKYVDYDFVFFPNGGTTAGSSVKEDYIVCYNESNFNTENSTVKTAFYELGFSARWKEDMLKITTEGSTGEDILDVHQGTLDLERCARTTTTYSRNRGVIVNAINRPIRSIRAVMGSNSGPFNQVTLFFSECQVNYQTDFRVHNNDGASDVYDIFDFSEAMLGSTYANEYNTDPIKIDGRQDLLALQGLPEWSFYNGDAGAIAIAAFFESNMPVGQTKEDVESGNAELVSNAYYDDNSSRANYICTGDGKAYGSSGFVFISDQCTDIRFENVGCAATIASPRVTVMSRVHHYLSPKTSQEEAQRYAAFSITPLTGSVSNAEFFPDGALPVELLTFTAKQAASTVLLEWATASEMNFDRYELERSTDAISFQKIASVAGQINATAQQNYAYKDQPKLSSNRYYYRLKMIDQDGSFEYSPIRSVKFSHTNWKATIYPNPTASQHARLHIESPDRYLAEISIYDLNGRRLSDAHIQLQRGENNIVLNTGDLDDGLYTVMVKQADGKWYYERLVVAD
ncbi:MAG: T9SS type A sorting domain-containing protein [Bacteroidota bacterium]